VTRAEPQWIIAASVPEHRACVVAAIDHSGPRVCLICDQPAAVSIMFTNLLPGLVVATRACRSHALGSKHEIAQRARDAVVFVHTPAPEAA
jgi:hypothetical protein